MDEEKLMELPPGVTVKDEFCVGVNYMYEGKIVMQWLIDDNFGRRQVWYWYHHYRKPKLFDSIPKVKK